MSTRIKNHLLVTTAAVIFGVTFVGFYSGIGRIVFGH